MRSREKKTEQEATEASQCLCSRGYMHVRTQFYFMWETPTAWGTGAPSRQTYVSPSSQGEDEVGVLVEDKLGLIGL